MGPCITPFPHRAQARRRRGSHAASPGPGKAHARLSLTKQSPAHSWDPRIYSHHGVLRGTRKLPGARSTMGRGWGGHRAAWHHQGGTVASSPGREGVPVAGAAPALRSPEQPAIESHEGARAEEPRSAQAPPARLLCPPSLLTESLPFGHARGFGWSPVALGSPGHQTPRLPLSVPSRSSLP